MVFLGSAMTSFTGAVAGALVLLAARPTMVTAQDNTACISLNGSAMCPSFAGRYINPTNLSGAYPFFDDVNDVASFDRLFARYYVDYDQFRQTQLHSGLQCNQSGFLNATLQWSRTVLCGLFTAASDNVGCTPDTDAARTRVCQSTCTQYSESEYNFVANASYCTPTDELARPEWVQIRNNTLINDYTSCTDWTSIYTTNDTSCILGVSNEGNCGFGNGPNAQLCAYCDLSGGTSIPSCCYEQKTNLTDCSAFGYPGAALVRPTNTVPPGTTSPNETGTASSSDSGLDKGELAGVIIGSIVGAALLLALLALLIFCCCCGGRRKMKQREPESQGIMRGNSSSHSPSEKPYHVSQESSRSRAMSHDKHGEALAAGVIGGAALGAAGKHSPTQDLHAPGSGADSRPLSTATSGTDGRGTTVASVRCQYTGQDIAPGDTVVAIYPYSAGLSDELDLTPESREELTVVRIYDDGWCLLKTPSGKEGAAPLVCCQSSKGELPAHMRQGSTGAFDSSGGTTSGNTDDETSGSRSGGLGLRGTGAAAGVGAGAGAAGAAASNDGYATTGGYTSGGGYQTAGGAETGMTSSVGGAVTADEYGFTSDAASR